jgi:competence ComEA-like helix-hairpin-helix protein
VSRSEVMLYSRPQLRLLLLLTSIFLVGLGVREWRAGFPALADRLERFDRDEPIAPLLPAAPGEDSPAQARPKQKMTSAASSPTRPEARESPAAAAEPPSQPLDLNRATAADLQRLPGIGPGLAQRILAERERRGRFESPEALRQVMGVGPKKLAALRDLVTVGE